LRPSGQLYGPFNRNRSSGDLLPGLFNISLIKFETSLEIILFRPVLY
jgi:hypothetical protein